MSIELEKTSVTNTTHEWRSEDLREHIRIFESANSEHITIAVTIAKGDGTPQGGWEVGIRSHAPDVETAKERAEFILDRMRTVAAICWIEGEHWKEAQP